MGLWGKPSENQTIVSEDNVIKGEVITFYDTNALLHCEKSLEEIPHKIFLSSVTLSELENIKTSDKKTQELRYNARVVTRFLRNNPDSFECITVTQEHYDIVENLKLKVENDALISACAYKLSLDNNVTFKTYDMACFNLAKHCFGLNCIGDENEKKEEYKGFQIYRGSSSEINSLFNQYMNNCFNILKLEHNEYLIIENTDTGDTSEYKYKEDNLEPLVLPNSKVVKALNAQQRCAIDLLNNDDIPIKVICGEFGSGKTYLAVRNAVNKIKQGEYGKIMFVRNPEGDSSSAQIGYLPGTQEEKCGQFFKSISDQLDGGEQELEKMKSRCEVETQIPLFMKGISVPNSYIVVDESEDLSTQTFKLIGGRLAKNSVIAFVGDVKQAEKKYKGDNGLRKFINYAKGNPLVGIMCMTENIRSEASSVFVDFE